MKERKYKLYIHTNKSNGKKYIGITSKKKAEYRWANGYGYRPNKHFYSAIEKYGWDGFNHEILFDGLTKDEAEQLEIELIAKYKTTDREYGYNRDNGGNTIGTHSDETRKKLSITHIGDKHPMYGKKHTLEARLKMSENTKGSKHPLYGKHHTEETKEKIRNSKKGKCIGDKNSMYGIKGADNPVSKKVVQLNKDNLGVISVYDSLTIASENICGDTGNISKCCTGKIKTYKGFKWMFLSEYERMINP